MTKVVKKKRKLHYILPGMLGVLVLIPFINFFPTFQRRTPDMSVYKGEWIDVYYEEEALAARDVFEYADNNVKSIAEKLGFHEKQNIRVLIYDSQKHMQQKSMD